MLEKYSDIFFKNKYIKMHAKYYNKIIEIF